MKKSPKRRPFAYLQVAGRTGAQAVRWQSELARVKACATFERSASRSRAASHNYVHHGEDNPRTLNLCYSCARQCPWEPLPRSTSGRSLMLSSFRGRTDQRASRDSTSPGTFCYVDNDRVCLCGLPDRSPAAQPSLQETVLPSIPIFLLDNALHSCNPRPPIHGRSIRWRVKCVLEQ